MKPTFYILAGANGSGKSTISKVFLPAEGVACVNPDDIAKEMNPRHPEKVQVAAGREALRRVDDFIQKRVSFAIESTLSGFGYRKTIVRAREEGFRVAIIYAFVDSPAVCIARIAARVMRGGHDVPAEDVKRRYWKSKRNFWNEYAPMADYWTLLYNGEAQVVMVAKKDSGGVAVFSNPLLKLFKEGL
ncbi:MAG: zeta toxin family protein [Kiritimatiellae bacterium]|nr:zeta toxin family protein [Kiritimatiellia bacterium]